MEGAGPAALSPPPDAAAMAPATPDTDDVSASVSVVVVVATAAATTDCSGSPASLRLPVGVLLLGGWGAWSDPTLRKEVGARTRPCTACARPDLRMQATGVALLCVGRGEGAGNGHAMRDGDGA